MEREFTPDGIEHETLQRPGTYDDPSVHFAVNCASIGCPMLREEAYAADRLDAPLEELEVSMIFTSFKEDRMNGYRSFDGKSAPLQSREQFLRATRCFSPTTPGIRISSGNRKPRFATWTMIGV